ncbi:MAG TPA: hypothetical protein VNG53_01740 [Bacteroidia bacterium]|nr:hypothetical protein [Bacteroidia bacterium]
MEDKNAPKPENAPKETPKPVSTPKENIEKAGKSEPILEQKNYSKLPSFEFTPPAPVKPVIPTPPADTVEKK